MSITTTWLPFQKLVQADIEEKSKFHRTTLVWEESISDQWIPSTKHHGFPSQRASDAVSISMSRCHHVPFNLGNILSWQFISWWPLNQPLVRRIYQWPVDSLHKASWIPLTRASYAVSISMSWCHHVPFNLGNILSWQFISWWHF